MGQNYDPVYKEETPDSGRMIIMHPLYLPKLPPWLDLKVFYIRICNYEVDESTPGHLTVNHIPLHPDTVLEVNGRRSSIYSDCVSSYLRRDRFDKKSEETTFVSTDNIRITGSVRFEVFDGDDLLLTGVLELCDDKNDEGESKGRQKKWSIKCQSLVSSGVSFLKGKQYKSPEMPLPTIEVYIAGCFSGTPIILTKTLKVGLQKRNQKSVLDSIPEHDTVELKNDALQLSDYEDYKMDSDTNIDYSSLYPRAEYTEEEDGDLSWFNAGVRVGVGISLGICLGVGVGVGLLIRSYQATSKNFKRLL
ncbi:uncharacterized protein At1g01500-like [Dendrobium catenatum]|uniref:Erythronate-4-phosphate dehydrogenase family protein n=1 Tax=Dendrobium catenatum TaxID=906689 RepID=A0A2I0VQZ8_9ASPA|nr:uncharacterized protein At1g01500-like [Dendrobium catenatum]XP_020704350.1 uncharacterized protein At1g01500-like [Dendrobium catenatum]XP_020704351.1 uncharacterized protein At1g01500-like [Dendrobium catenatum]XP_020704353.1 uncharacterized protein At1g01500-like [Dendrobium catenatum]XP_028556147.1 uncharacterized protein At1g01500-like [Dendrobium catenatum]PKU65830.1 Uncharacterized protein MA16_Dca009159 [Dendrobium catenatum]